ncbi:MAG: hypothetical protein AAF485_31910, partial [Chloroflexota bacterium]
MGEVLQKVVQDAYAKLWRGKIPSDRQTLVDAVKKSRQLRGNKGPQYAFLILELRYFRQYFSVETQPKMVRDIANYLLISSPRFFVHLEKAIELLSDIVLRTVQPTLQLERIYRPTKLVGRDQLVDSCLKQLQEKKNITLSGLGGIGKTALGMTVVGAWTSQTVFWYTFRPNLNDNLASVLFALGHFIQQHITSVLWLQLLANRGDIGNVEEALGLLRNDLRNLKTYQPVCCFDEVDLLHTGSANVQSSQHIQLLGFLEVVCEETPTILIGQRAYIDTDIHHVLEGLDSASVQKLLNKSSLQLSPAIVAQVVQYTNGTPRLVELVITLLQLGDNLKQITSLHKRAEARPLFHRLWRRLDATEQEILATLSVFLRPTPMDSWEQYENALQKLQERRVLLIDAAEMITIQPFIRELVYEQLLPEQAEILHVQAGQFWALRGEYTIAAYHFWKAEAYGHAVSVWYPHRKFEIERGYSQTASSIFHSIKPTKLEGREQKWLKIIQNDLSLLLGKAEQVVNGMAQTWDINDAVSAEAYFQLGEANRMLGRFE